MIPSLLKPPAVWIFERLALNGLAAGDLPRARSRFETLRRIAPERRGVEYNLALIAFSLGRYEEAAAGFEREAKRHGDSPELLRARADLAFARGMREEASSFYDELLAAETRPGERPFLELRRTICRDGAAFSRALEGAGAFEEGNAFLREGRLTEAEEAFRRCAEADPSHFLALNNLGAIALEAHGDEHGARDYFARAASLADHPLVRANQARLRARRPQEEPG